MVNGARSSTSSSVSLVVVETLVAFSAPTSVTVTRYPRIKPFLASWGRAPQLREIEVELSARTEKSRGAAAGTVCSRRKFDLMLIRHAKLGLNVKILLARN